MNLDEDLRACLADWNDEAVIAGRRVSGYFSSQPVDEGAGEDAVYGFAHVFGCHADDAAGVEEGTPIEVVGRGQFRVIRIFGPYESGLVEIQLGSFL